MGMERQTLQLREVLGDRAEWHFLDAPLPMTTSGEMQRAWYLVGHEATTDQPALKEVEPAVDYILGYIQEHGPFQVLLGFSQGGDVSNIVAAQLRERGEPIPWRLSVLFCGMRPLDARYYQAFSPPLSLPSVQIFGRSDVLYAFGRESLPHMFEKPLILEHDEGH